MDSTFITGLTETLAFNCPSQNDKKSEFAINVSLIFCQRTTLVTVDDNPTVPLFVSFTPAYSLFLLHPIALN